jgi:caa(3)-type oxidase subunit IV
MSDLLDPRAVHKEHTHPGAGLYLKVGFVLLVLTALEVAAYEVGHRPGALQPIVGPWVVEILLVLSAVKFYLVAMFYMHLKQDAQIFKGLFVFPLIIAAMVIIALLVLMAYWRT